jgi:hypothetical protein
VRCPIARARHVARAARGFEELFENSFPQAAREFAEKTIDQTREAYARSNRTLEAAVQTLERSFDAAGQSAAALRRNIIGIAQRNLDLGFDLAKGLAGARNISEIVELQTAYWRRQFDVITTQPDEVHNQLFESGTAKPKTTKPASDSIRHETAKKAPSRAQEATKHSPTERDRVEWHRRDRQKLARPSATGPTVRPSVAKQSAPQKKGAPKDEPFRQSLPAEIKFGMLDGNAVRFTNLEAWWLVDGAWRPISPDEVLLNAAVMREARFNQLFPNVPGLPSNAFKSENLQD